MRIRFFLAALAVTGLAACDAGTSNFNASVSGTGTAVGFDKGVGTTVAGHNYRRSGSRFGMR